MKVIEELCEVLGMFSADGGLQKKYICIWGNIKEDRDYYDKVVCPLFSKVFEKKIIAHEKKSNSVYGFYICDKKIVNFLRKMEFSNNKTYNVKVPNIILSNNNQNLYAAFIRGFVDCDGYISFMKRKGKYQLFKRKFNTYPRIGIKAASKNIIKDLSYMLKKLDIEHTINVYRSKKLNWADIYIIEIRGKTRIMNYINKIGFNNPSQYSKYEVWKKFGFCPPSTTIKQRKLILQNKLDPYSFY